jgi:hypothetical protein
MMHLYEVCPRRDHRGLNLISDALPFGPLWYDGLNAAANAIDYAKFYSRSHDAVIRVYDAAGNVIDRLRHVACFPNSRFKFQKRVQLFTRAYYEPFSVATRGISNRDVRPWRA